MEALADASRMSARNFARVFAQELGNTPARYVEQVRVEAARTLLASTDDSVDQIANRCGFSSAELLRRCFLRHFKVAPSQYRKHFHAALRGGHAEQTMTSRPPEPASVDIAHPESAVPETAREG